jgi:alpha-N-arabinofuranosidase
MIRIFAQPFATGRTPKWIPDGCSSSGAAHDSFDNAKPPKYPASCFAGGRRLRSSVVSLAAAVMLKLAVFPCPAQEPTARASLAVRIDARKPAPYKIPRSIFGAFLEPIGNSIYNGLWAEILENPGFEENLWSASNIAELLQQRPELTRSSELALPLPWQPLYPSQGARYAPEWDDAANSSRSLLLMSLPDQQTGVRQRVYLPVHRILRYLGSVDLKPQSGPAEVEISIRKRDHPEETIAFQKLSISGTDWRRYEYSLNIPPGRLAPLEPADFVIAVDHETRVLVDRASLFPADSMDGMDPDMIAMARAMKPSIVRFGGNFTSAYHWRDGIGPPDKRRGMLNIAWGMPEYNRFGTDEFLRFCQLIGAEPQIALNLGTGTPDEAAAWVQYVNSRWGEHRGGLLWELGNELWGTFQVGYPTIARIADRTKLFSQAVRKVDPNAQLIATGADPDHFREWNAAQLASGSSFNYLSTHFVVTTNAIETPNATDELIAKATFALPVELERRLRAMRQQFQSSPVRNSVKTAFTEWLFWAPSGVYPRYDNMGGAIGAGGFFNMLLRTADLVPISDMTGIVEFGGIWKKRGRVFGTPAYWVFRMYSTSDLTTPVETTSDGETYNLTGGESRLPSIAAVPYLDVVAGLNDAGDKLTLFCVNRDLHRDLRARIEIVGFHPGPRALAHTLYADNIYEKNDEMQPERLHPYDDPFSLAGDEFTYDFRHESVTEIELQRSDPITGR